MVWEPNDQAINYLIERGRLERITPRRETAEHLVKEARKHLESAAALAQTDDTSMTFVAAYDAARKSLSAILGGLSLEPTVTYVTELNRIVKS